MESTDFLKDQIDKLTYSFPNIKCRYEVDTWDNTHTFEITPGKELKNDSDLFKYLRDLEIRFNKIYNNELLLCIDNTVEYPIENPIYEKEGYAYIIFRTLTENNMKTEALINEINIKSNIASNLNFTKNDNGNFKNICDGSNDNFVDYFVFAMAC